VGRAGRTAHRVICETAGLRFTPPMQIGIDSFAANFPDPATGVALSPATRMRNLLEEWKSPTRWDSRSLGSVSTTGASFSIPLLQSSSPQPQPRPARSKSG